MLILLTIAGACIGWVIPGGILAAMGVRITFFHQTLLAFAGAVITYAIAR